MRPHELDFLKELFQWKQEGLPRYDLLLPQPLYRRLMLWKFSIVNEIICKFRFFVYLVMIVFIFAFQELSKMVKNAREEHSRRGGYVRIFPTTETWSLYGSILEFSSPNNQILHEHLFPDAMKKHHPHNQVGFRNRRLAARVFMSSEAR